MVGPCVYKAIKSIGFACHPVFIFKKKCYFYLQMKFVDNHSLKLVTMTKYLLRLSLLQLLAVFVAVGTFSGCKSEKEQKKNDDIVQVDSIGIDEQLIKDVRTVKEIFYSLPSPLETAMILKQAGAQYNEELLNPVDKTTGYVTNRSMALNLGIYTTDLSYASLFDQTQATIQYMDAAKKMADGLGVLNAIDDQVIERLEANINNRDVIMDIISETIMTSSSFFEENDRQAMSAIVLVGGWVEGLHIAASLVDPEAELSENELVSRVVDQKMTLNTVLKLLERNKQNEDVQEILTDMHELEKIYNKIEVTSSKIETVTDEETNVTTLRSQKKTSMSKDTFMELTEQIKVIRDNFTL